MPLTWKTVTVASRIMLPAHAILSAGIGLSWVLQDGGRTQTKALSLVNVWPIMATGTILCVLAACVVGGILSGRRPLAAIALLAGMLVYVLLAVALCGASFTSHASFSAALWPAYVATAHLASALSLAHDELTDIAGNHRRVA